MKLTISPALIRQYLIVTLVTFGSLTTGISMSWPSPMILKLNNGTDSPLSRPITEEEGSWIVSGGYLVAIFNYNEYIADYQEYQLESLVMILAGIHGNLLRWLESHLRDQSQAVSIKANVLGGILIDKIGRKYCIILVTLPRIIVSVWIIFVTEVWMLILCRVVMVMTDCFIFIVVPVYVSEIASKEHRGALGTFVHISSCAGIVIALAVGPFLSYVALNTILATVIILTALPLPFIPDSPVYLHSKGNINDSIAILSKIRNSDEIVKQELEDYKSSKVVKIDKVALLQDKIFLKSLALGIIICGGSNLIGYNAVSFYLQTILESTQTSVHSNVASVVIGVIQIIAALCTTFFTRLFGRRPILIYSMIGMFFGMMGLGTYFKISTAPGYVVTGFLNYLPIISLILVTYCFNVGIGCLVFVVTAEVFDGPARAFGYSICLMTAFLIAFLTTKYLAQMTTALGPSVTYWIFSSMCFLVGTLIFFFFPETKGKTFSEIQIALGRKNVGNEIKKKQKQDC